VRVVQLFIPTARAADWTAMLVVSVVTIGLAGVARPVPDVLLLVLRMSGVLLGAAAAFILIDPMASSTRATPVPRWRRQWLRTALALGPAMAAWAVTFALAGRRTTFDLPWAGLALEALVCSAIGVAATAFALRRVPGKVAALAAPAAQVALIGISLLGPDESSPWPSPGSPQWTEVHRYWLAGLVVTLLALAWANLDR
jgi:drug/metabolite transporter (DMT)-like permease